ncbi:MAG: 50S ribosomal protein L22 [Endomicrobium sp.]|jgi:large subunit ribosomal protein L22|nr:50S ribosomal protein L22 [Endomicrobium sp.]
MEATAIAKFIRCSPRKVNQVLKLIRKKNVNEALINLSQLNKSSSLIIRKVLKNALANINEKNKMNNEKIHPVIKEAWVCCGPTLKRMRPGPRGRAMAIKKRTSHITVVVAG